VEFLTNPDRQRRIAELDKIIEREQQRLDRLHIAGAVVTLCAIVALIIFIV
jgi:hypothetical protein